MSSSLFSDEKVPLVESAVMSFLKRKRLEFRKKNKKVQVLFPDNSRSAVLAKDGYFSRIEERFLEARYNSCMDRKEEPLHKHLDMYIKSAGWSPEGACSMLSGLDPESAKDLVANSFEVPKLFQLDFFHRCGKAELPVLMSLLANSGNQTMQCYFMWQVLGSNSTKAAMLKYDCRSLFAKWKKSMVPHPYAYGHERYVRSLDLVCRRICESRFRFPDAFVSADQASAGRLLDPERFGCSLFQGRILSTDVFKRLGPAEQWKFLRALPTGGTSIVFRAKFVFSIIEDPEISPEIKAATVRAMSHGVEPYASNVFKKIDSKLRELLRSCFSFGEFDIYRNAVQDSAIDRKLVLFFLYFRPRWLMDWYEVEPDEIDGILRCRSTAEELARTERRELD